jgi:polyisoprenoid-binding protein YceI
MMISKVRGHFERFSGTIDIDESEPARSMVDVKVETASINTRDPQRDAHLRSPDFFDAEKYPYMTFKSNRVEVIDDHHAKLYGDLTIKDITHEIKMDVEYTGSAKSPWGTTSFGFLGETRINRKDWNLTWNKALETGGMLVGDDIDIEIELELVKVPEEVTEAQAK